MTDYREILRLYSLGFSKQSIADLCSRSTILCTQYDTEEWYERISPNQDGESTISDAILDRIIHNAHDILLEGSASMRERHGLKAALEAGEEN